MLAACWNALSSSAATKFCWLPLRRSTRQNNSWRWRKGTQAAGLILIYSPAALDLPAKHALNTLAADDFFDLAAEHLPADDHAALEKILPRFESLRIQRRIRPIRTR